MGLFLLKAGSFNLGTIGDPKNPPRYYKASDAKNNVVESDLDLVNLYPDKFAHHEGPVPQFATGTGAPTEERPPGPPTDWDRAQAMAMKPTTVGQARERAKQLREQADQLEQSALESERAFQQEQQRQESMQKQQPQQGQQPPPSKQAQGAEEGDIPSDQELNQMTKEELQTLAEESGVQVKASATKAELVQALRAARG